MEELKQMAKKKEPTNGELMAKEIIAKYKPKTVEDMQNALKDIFGPMFEAMLNGEMDNHLGYASNDHGARGLYFYVPLACSDSFPQRNMGGYVQGVRNCF